MDSYDLSHSPKKPILILNVQCYECTSIGYDDEPGGNCSDSQPGGKVVKYCTIVFWLLSLYLLFLVGVFEVPYITLFSFLDAMRTRTYWMLHQQM